jgi:hypothetical protein
MTRTSPTVKQEIFLPHISNICIVGVILERQEEIHKYFDVRFGIFYGGENKIRRFLGW